MSKIAVIKTGGKQYLVKKGDVFKCEKLKVKQGDQVEFDCLLTSGEDGKELKIGTPVLDTKVKGKVVEQGRGKKTRVVHYKAKTRYHKVYGHRQPHSKVEVVGIL